jgi:hypothetical protein
MRRKSRLRDRADTEIFGYWLSCETDIDNMPQAKILPNNLTQGVTFLTRVRKISGSSLGRDTSYTKAFLGFSQFCRKIV